MRVKPKTGVTLANWDNAPGCIRTDFKSIAALFKKKLTNSSKKTECFIDANVEKFTFMPTVSCLDINWPMDNTNMFRNIRVADVIKNKLTPFEDYYAPETENLQHVQITTPMTSKLIQWIGENERDLFSLPNSKGANYNYGFARRWIPSVSINNGGTLRINNEGATSYGASSPSFEPEYETYLFDCGGATVNINRGGKLIVGAESSSKRGVIKVLENSQLNILAGGQLELRNGSKIIVEAGGILRFSSDNATYAALLKNNSQIIIEKGGKLIVEGTNPITFSSDASNTPIAIYGELVANAPMKLRNKAYLRFEKTNKVSFTTPNPVFNVEGSSRNDLFIQLVKDTEVKINNASVLLKQGYVEYHPNARFELNNSPSTQFYTMKFIGTNGDAFILKNSGSMELHTCDFQGFNKAIYATEQSDRVRVRNSKFLGNGIGIGLMECTGEFQSYDSEFDLNGVGLYAKSNSRNHSNIERSKFTRNGTGIAYVGAYTYFRLSDSYIAKNGAYGIALEDIDFTCDLSVTI
jgi:hypothetical protein